LPEDFQPQMNADEHRLKTNIGSDFTLPSSCTCGAVKLTVDRVVAGSRAVE